MVREDFNKLEKEFEDTLQRLASDITTGFLFERLPPMELWKRAEANVTKLKRLTEKCKELMLILKPERTFAVEQKFNIVIQGLTNFREILFQNSAEPFANSRLAFEQLRNTVIECSEFLLLIREVKDNPSPLIKEVLRLKEVLEHRGTVVTIEVPEKIQPMLERLARNIENLRNAMIALERALQNVKEQMRILQEDSIRFTNLEENVSGKEDATKEKQAQEAPESRKGQLLLSEFKN